MLPLLPFLQKLCKSFFAAVLMNDRRSKAAFFVDLKKGLKLFCSHFVFSTIFVEIENVETSFSILVAIF